MGVLWSAWHFFANFWSSGVTSGEISLAIWLPAWLLGALVGQLTPFRVLMVWVYDRTGSLLVAMLMHASLTASLPLILLPPARGVPLLTSYLVLAAALWVVVAVVARANGGQLSRQPFRRRLA